MVEEKVEPKYEDKYLEQVRKMNKEWDFRADEITEQMSLSQKIFNQSKEKVISRIEELQADIVKLDKETEEETGLDVEYYYDNKEGDELLQKTTFEERCDYRKRKVDELQKEVDELLLEIGSPDWKQKLILDAEKQSIDNIIGKRIDKLANCFIMDTTPLGNVLMIYNKDRESFAYYSDSNIPYRYLEPVARKYVKSFNCRPLYIDMEEELKLIEEKWDKDQEMKRLKEEEESKRIAEMIASGVSSLEKAEDSNKKKNVFAKLKSYNKDAGGGGKISMAPPPKNSIPGNPVIPETNENAKILLKERANRYTYDGKFANFSFLKKVERKVFNKKLALTFAEFKSML
jgi:DNA-binding protein H-NS